jgi:predicted transcriptional regulator
MFNQNIYIHLILYFRNKMATRSKTRDIIIVDKGGTFAALAGKLKSGKDKYDFESLSLLRKVLSNEKARLLNTIRTKKPGSIYELAKILERDFKSVVEDIKILERFGIIELIGEKSGKRTRHKPVVVVDSLYINLRLT